MGRINGDGKMIREHERVKKSDLTGVLVKR
jgi:hypothetical protein